MLKGVITAMITPFDSHGELDTQGLLQNIEFQIKSGIDGLLVLGTTGESPTLTEDEKIKIIEIAKDKCQKTHLMVGCGSNSTKQTITNTKLAKKMGANSALIVTPYYNKPTQEGIFQHFSMIANEVDIPIVIYNIPGRSGTNILPETFVRLAKIPNIIGVKESSGNLAQIEEILQKIPDFNLLSGDDGLTLPIMALGGQGVISVASNLVPAQIKEMVDCCLKFNFEKAKDCHFELLPLYRALFIETNPMPLKALMNMKGMKAGGCRPPLCDLMPASFDKLKLILYNP